MASYEQSENRKWSVRFRYVEFGKLKQKRLSGFLTKKEAEKAYSEFVTTHQQGKRSDYNKMTFNQLYDNYLNYSKNRLRVSTIYDITHNFNKHLLPVFGNMKIFDISKKDIFAWQNTLNQTSYSYKFKSKLRGFMIALFKYAVFYYDLPLNPVLQVEPFKRTEAKKEMLIWSEEEFKKFIREIDDLTFKTFFTFLYLTGCRKGEAFALTWNKIDFDKNIVTINQNLTRKTNNSNTYQIVPTKTNNSRSILIPTTLVDMLKQLRTTQLDYQNYNFVFGGEKPLADNTTTRMFNYATQKAGVKKIHIHCLRHSHASFLISHGESIVMVSKRLGHASIEQTLNTYSHLMPNEEEKMVSKLELKF